MKICYRYLLEGLILKSAMRISDNRFCNTATLSPWKFQSVKDVALFNLLTGNTCGFANIISSVLFSPRLLYTPRFNAFCSFCNRKNAEEAIQGLNGTVIGKQTVRLSWGRSPGNKHVSYIFFFYELNLFVIGLFYYKHYRHDQCIYVFRRYW